MGTVKRERQKQARQAKTVAEQSAARRTKARSTGLRVVVGVVVVLAVAFIASLALSDDSDDTSAPDDATTSTTSEYTDERLATEVLARQPPQPASPPADTPRDAAEAVTLIQGEGEGAEAGDTVTVHYVGVLSDGTQFDESWSRGTTIDVAPLGQASVIDGWNEGLVGAKIGERRRLVLGADKAYGSAGRPPNIPPDAPLAFEIDVVDIKPGA